jgi:hypothetical protein
MRQRPKEKDRCHLYFSVGLCIIWSFSFGLCIICPFLLAFVSSVLFFWPLYHQYFSFGLCIIWSFSFGLCIIKGPEDEKTKRKEQMIQRQKEKDR